MQKQPLFTSIDCIRLYVPDLEKGPDYYRSRLGLELIWKTDTESGLGMGEGITKGLFITDGEGNIIGQEQQEKAAA